MAGGNTSMYSNCVSVYMHTCVCVCVRELVCILYAYMECVYRFVHMNFFHLCVLHGVPGRSGALICEHW